MTRDELEKALSIWARPAPSQLGLSEHNTMLIEKQWANQIVYQAARAHLDTLPKAPRKETRWVVTWWDGDGLHLSTPFKERLEAECVRTGLIVFKQPPQIHEIEIEVPG